MRNLEIERSDSKEGLNKDELFSLGFGSKPSMKQTKESDWISASESLLE